jgi:hypothetical protein
VVPGIRLPARSIRIPARWPRAFLLLAAWSLLPAEVAGQAGRGAPQLEVTVIGNSPASGASVRASRMLSHTSTRELLLNGFPAAMRFRLELWRVGGMFDDIESATSWEVLVRYDPYSKLYSVYRRDVQATEDIGSMATLEAVEAQLARPFPVSLRPRRPGARYYYNVTVDVETLSVSDLDELNRWLRGELQPAVRGKRAPLSALRRGFGTLLSRVLGGDSRHYVARSGTFTA